MAGGNIYKVSINKVFETKTVSEITEPDLQFIQKLPTRKITGP